MTTTTTLDRLARPMPTTGRLGVVTLWSLWLTAPATVVSVYTGIVGTWIPFFFVLLGCAVWASRSTNTRVDGKPPSESLSRVARVAPFLILAAVAIGYLTYIITGTPIATVIAGILTLGFAIGITSTVAATPPPTTRDELDT